MSKLSGYVESEPVESEYVESEYVESEPVESTCVTKNKSTRDNSISPDSKLNCPKGITELLLHQHSAEPQHSNNMTNFTLLQSNISILAYLHSIVQEH